MNWYELLDRHQSARAIPSVAILTWNTQFWVSDADFGPNSLGGVLCGRNALRNSSVNAGGGGGGGAERSGSRPRKRWLGWHELILLAFVFFVKKQHTAAHG